MSDLLARAIVDALRHREWAVRRDDWDVVVVRHPRTARTVATIAIHDGRPTLDSVDDMYRPGIERTIATAIERYRRERQLRRQRGAARARGGASGVTSAEVCAGMTAEFLMRRRELDEQAQWLRREVTR